MDGNIVGSFIQTNSITANQLSSDVGQTLDLSSNVAITTRVTKTEFDAGMATQSNDLATAETRITTEVTTKQDTWAVTYENRLINAENALTDYSTYLRWDAPTATLTLGKSTSPFTTAFSNEMLAFLESGSVAAYIKNNEMRIKNVVAEDSAIIGNHKIYKYDSELTIIAWVGGV